MGLECRVFVCRVAARQKMMLADKFFPSVTENEKGVLTHGLTGSAPKL